MRRSFIAAGVLLLCVAWSPWARELSEQYFSAHMAVHMTVVAIAAPILALGLQGTLADWRLRAPGLRILRLARRSLGEGGLLSPIPASIVELIVVWTWHVPALHHAARADASLFAIEQASFIASGLFLWGSVFLSAGPGIVALLVTFAHMTLLGAVISLSPRVLYGHAPISHALLDQQIGGTIMLIVSASVYTAGALWLGYVSLQREVWVRS